MNVPVLILEERVVEVRRLKRLAYGSRRPRDLLVKIEPLRGGELRDQLLEPFVLP